MVLAKSVRGKYKADQVDEYIAELRKEYEDLASQQRQRIMDLRNENSEIKKEMQDFEGKKSMIISTLMSAQNTSKEIIDNAKKQADLIVEEAGRKEENLLETIERYTDMLVELGQRCQNIQDAIEHELDKLDRTKKPNLFGIEPYKKAKV